MKHHAIMINAQVWY